MVVSCLVHYVSATLLMHLCGSQEFPLERGSPTRPDEQINMVNFLKGTSFSLGSSLLGMYGTSCLWLSAHMHSVPYTTPRSYVQIPAQCQPRAGAQRAGVSGGMRVLDVRRRGSDMRHQSILHTHDLDTS